MQIITINYIDVYWHKDNKICITRKGNETYAGNVFKKIDGEGNTTLYHYDGLDRLVKVSTFDGEKEAEISSYTYNAEGNINKEINGSKNTVTFEYTASDSVKEKTCSKTSIQSYKYHKLKKPARDVYVVYYDSGVEEF